MRKFWFLGSSRSNPFCMGERVGCFLWLAWLNTEVWEQVIAWQLLGVDVSFETHGKTLVLEQLEYKKSLKRAVPVGIAYTGVPCSGWFSPVGSNLGSWWPSGN